MYRIIIVVLLNINFFYGQETKISAQILDKNNNKIKFENIEEKEENDEWTDEMQDARDWCEQIIISKFMELISQAHETAKERKLNWGNIPVYFTEHAYNFIAKSDA